MRHDLSPRLARPFTCTLALAILAAAPTTLHASPAHASQTAPDDMPAPAVVVADAPIRAVTLYRGQAMVSRMAAAPAGQGLFELRFEALPPSVDPESLQATVTGGAKLLDVRFETTETRSDAATNPALREAIARLEAARRLAERQGMELAAIANRHAFLEAIRAKTATEAAKEVGTKDLDTKALAQQMEFLDAAQATLIADRVKLDDAVRANADEIRVLESQVQSLGGETKVERVAVVSIGKASTAPSEVVLRYLARDAGWAPRYAVRADLGGKSLVVEYDAEIRQATGEDWNGVALVLSTAEPSRRAAPREVSSAFVDLLPPPPPPTGEPGGMRAKAGEGGRMRGTTGAPEMTPGAPGEPDAERMYFGADPASAGDAPAKLDAGLARRFSDATAASAGSVVNYEIPRATSIASDASRARRLRIASIDTQPAFMHVARPLVESSVFIRARAANSSEFQFLPGPATVFVGGDSVGLVTLPAVAPGGEMTFWLGVDPRVTAKRVLVKKESLVEGAFDKSDVTRWDFRVDLASTAPQPVEVELVDRIPVSRNKEIKVELENDLKKLGAPLSTDAKYLADERPQGILKWIVALPGQVSAGKPSTRAVAWGVRVARPKGVAITGLPE